MKSIIIPSVDYSAQRVSIPEINLPPIGRALRHILAPAKYDAATGILVDPIAADWTHSAFVINGEKPVLSTPAAMGLKTCLSFARETGKRKDLKGRLNCENTKWTISVTFANSSALAQNTNRVLFTFLADLENGKQNMMRYYSSGSAGKTRLLMSQSSGSLVFGSSTNTVSLDNPLTQASSNATRINVSLVGDSELQRILVYTNGVLTDTINTSYVSALKGDMYLGVSLTIADETGDFFGSMGEMVIHDDALTATEVASMHTFLTAAFS